MNNVEELLKYLQIGGRDTDFKEFIDSLKNYKNTTEDYQELPPNYLVSEQDDMGMGQPMDLESEPQAEGSISENTSPISGGGGGPNYQAIGSAIGKTAEVAADAIDTYGQFKKDITKGGLSILSSIIPDTPSQRIRSERMAIDRDAYGRQHFNNMFRDGGTISRAEEYLEKNYKKLADNKDRREFLESIINLKK